MTKLRFAPSPTGYLHLGNTRTALINWLFAKRNQGQFILRLDDTDVVRSHTKYVEQIFDDLDWLGLKIDEVVKQSDRLKKYDRAADSLREKGRLYPCYETPEELELQRKLQLSSGKPPIYNRAALSLGQAEIEKLTQEGRRPHWRFKMESREIHWNDLIRGEVSFQGDHISDPILIREDGTPVYTLATAVDDLDMGITHILRGEDHVTNTAIQIQLMEAISGKANTIEFGHLALITGSKGEGLSKRTGSLSLLSLQKEGLEPMGINSLLAKLGTSDPIVPHTSLEGVIADFDIHKFGRATPKLDTADLWLMNTKILQMLSYDQVKPRLDEMGMGEVSPEFWSLVQQNISSFKDLHDWWTICYGHKAFQEDNISLLEVAENALPPEPWDDSTFKGWISDVKEETGLKGKELFMPLRRALTGKDHGPELKDLILLLGRPKVMTRLKNARGT